MNEPTLFDGIERIEIFVEGKPFTKGSVSAFLVNAAAMVQGGLSFNPKTRKSSPRVRPIINVGESSTKNARRERKEWRKKCEDAIAWEWHEKVGRKIPKSVPVAVELFFLFRRPASVKPWERPRPTAKLDIDKLARMVLDCMTAARVYEDDEQVCKLVAEKDYASETSTTGVRIRISAM